MQAEYPETQWQSSPAAVNDMYVVEQADDAAYAGAVEEEAPRVSRSHFSARHQSGRRTQQSGFLDSEAGVRQDLQEDPLDANNLDYLKDDLEYNIKSAVRTAKKGIHEQNQLV